MTLMRAQYAWFPFHPLGFALAPTWAMMVFWFGFFVAWVIRSLALRYGGLQMYRRLTPLMLGLIIGEFTMAVFWAVMIVLSETANRWQLFGWKNCTQGHWGTARAVGEARSQPS